MKSIRNWPLTYGEPNWVPLEAALAPEQREDYMYMGEAGPIVLYKHRWTRRYLNIGLDGVTFFRHSDVGYEEIDRSEALDDART
jgi:hypothetical protein